MASSAIHVPVDQPYVPNSEAVADFTACIAHELRKTLDAAALDLAIAIEAPEGEGVNMAIEEALLARLAALLSRPNLRIADLSADRITQALGSSLLLD